MGGGRRGVPDTHIIPLSGNTIGKVEIIGLCWSRYSFIPWTADGYVARIASRRGRGIKVSASIVRLLRRTSARELFTLPRNRLGHSIFMRFYCGRLNCPRPVPLSLSLSLFRSLSPSSFSHPVFLHGIIHGKAVWFLQEFPLFRVREARERK